MLEKISEDVISIVLAIVGVAILAVIVGRNSRTSEVITSAGNALTGLLNAATSPVRGF